MLKKIILPIVLLLLLAGLTFSQDNFVNEVYESFTDEGTSNPPYNPDWMGTDVNVYFHSGEQTNVTQRTLDMEYCEENGNLYLAACVNISGWHGLRVWCSSNSGLNWTLVGAFPNNSVYWNEVSMKVEQRYNGRPDSVRVNAFYTYSSGSSGDDAYVGFLSFKPHGGQPDLIVKVVANPLFGRKLAYPSAYSNGQYNAASTDIGCIFGEYNNAGTTCYSIIKVYMINWSWNFTGSSLTFVTNDHWFSADYKNDPSGVDSVYIAAERRLSSESRIRLWRTPAFNTGSWNYISITGSPYSYYYRKPCLTIVQNRYPTKIAITYTRNSTSGASYGLGGRSYSYNGGIAWSHGTLGGSYTTRYTGVSSDTNGGSGYCTFIWGDTDSLNVRRGTIVGGAGGTTYYDRASYTLTSSADPVCAVYNNSSGNYRRSTFAYWRYWTLVGVRNIYFDAEDLPTGITNTNGIANDYHLSQNYPNPFNPTTSINFSIPKSGLVRLFVYDMLGKEVAALVNSGQTAGSYQVTFYASKLTSGVYFYKLTSGDFSDVKKMLLVK